VGAPYIFESTRLGFRAWRDSDLLPFSALNADPEVMEYFPARLTPGETAVKMASYQQEIDAHGFGLWSTEVKATGEWIGFIGFHAATFESPFTPCIEIGWRLHRPFWGRGYATEGARRCLAFGAEIGLSTIYSFTAAINLRSERVMQKIGMEKMGEFLHPAIENYHPLQKHVFYRTFL